MARLPRPSGDVRCAFGARRPGRRSVDMVGWSSWGRSVFKREELPVVWNSLERVGSPARQYNAGCDKGVANGLADEDLVSLCDPNDAGGDVHRDTREVVPVVFDFTQVDAAAHSEAECRRRRFDRACDLD